MAEIALPPIPFTNQLIGQRGLITEPWQRWMTGVQRLAQAPTNGSSVTDVPWDGVLKAGSSLADLAVRSAGDLSSGTLLAGRLPPNLFAINALAPDDSTFIVGNGTTWVAESGATARTSLGLGTGDSPTFTDLTISGTLDVTGEITASGGLAVTFGGDMTLTSVLVENRLELILSRSVANEMPLMRVENLDSTANSPRSITGFYLRNYLDGVNFVSSSIHQYGENYNVAFFRRKVNLTNDAGYGVIVRSLGGTIEFVTGGSGGEANLRSTLTNAGVWIHGPSGTSVGSAAAYGARFMGACQFDAGVTANLTGQVLTASQTSITSIANLTTVGVLTGGATGAGFTVALSTSTITGNLPYARMPSAVGTWTGRPTISGTEFDIATFQRTGAANLGAVVQFKNSNNEVGAVGLNGAQHFRIDVPGKAEAVLIAPTTGAAIFAGGAIFSSVAAPTLGSNQAGLFSADIGGGIVGMRGIWEDGTVGTLGLVVTKTTTGDGTGHEGLFQINTFDTTIKMYGLGAWRQLYPGGAGSGDVVGPASATDSGFARFDGTTGKLLKDSAATIALGSEVSGDLPLANLAQASAASRFLVRGSAGGAGDWEEGTFGANLTLTGTELSASGGGGGSYTKIEEQTPTGTSVTFSSLGAYTHLEIVWSGRSDAASPAVSAVLAVTFNADSGSNYDTQSVQGAGSSASATFAGAGTSATIGAVAAGDATADMAGTGTLRLFDYRGTTFQKGGISEENFRRGTSSGTQFARQWSIGWRSTAAITSITITLSAGNFVAGSKFTLYGLE